MTFSREVPSAEGLGTLTPALHSFRDNRTAFGLQRDGRVPGEGTWFMTSQSWPHESNAQPNLPDDLTGS